MRPHGTTLCQLRSFIWLELLEKDDCNICYRFVGASNRTDTINYILESIIDELKLKNLIDLESEKMEGSFEKYKIQGEDSGIV